MKVKTEQNLEKLKWNKWDLEKKEFGKNLNRVKGSTNLFHLIFACNMK